MFELSNKGYKLLVAHCSRAHAGMLPQLAMLVARRSFLTFLSTASRATKSPSRGRAPLSRVCLRPNAPEALGTPTRSTALRYAR